METYLSVVLTLLTIITGILTIISYSNARKKDSNTESRNSGVMEQKIHDIDKRTETIQRDVKELREKDSTTASLVVAVQESAKSAHKRIDCIERRL